jgi:MFS family permease
MNLLMVATPLAMKVCGQPYSAAARVLEWHVIGMFVPGLFTGSLIGAVGVVPVMVAGCLLMLLSAAVALSGLELWHFTVALFALGVGWNFMYTGATTLLTTSYQPSEKNRVQGFNDACVFAVMVTSSFSSGALLHIEGWNTLNQLSVPFVLLALIVTLLASRSVGWRFGRTG